MEILGNAPSVLPMGAVAEGGACFTGHGREDESVDLDWQKKGKIRGARFLYLTRTPGCVYPGRVPIGAFIIWLIRVQFQWTFTHKQE